ncbi:hypothetical protein AOXY_G20730 [Acipenser oxyrinchus oxyrinchus]|uniref:Apoptosis regulatory protein Siva n=1 Tax=Acipenser oxyrinchus oxyrinchus TaxID=40147 RepID=A0AAD8G186_ACIOX|nr:hypothetical protein AOXY_G20730 [Acipenser oxyrinchus oxyrinchus]
MPKRTYPFSETFSLQYKMHIGQKEMNQGVFGNKYRQEVYEKTKNLLFNGTKAIMGKMCKADDSSRSRTGDQSPSPAAALMRGQTLIGQDGTLTRNSAVPNAVASGVPACSVCLKSASVKESCAQCERATCRGCSRTCSSCASVCCSVCTVTDYSDRYDRVLCCDCTA